MIPLNFLKNFSQQVVVEVTLLCSYYNLAMRLGLLPGEQIRHTVYTT